MGYPGGRYGSRYMPARWPCPHTELENTHLVRSSPFPYKGDGMLSDLPQSFLIKLAFGAMLFVDRPETDESVTNLGLRIG